MTDGRPARTRDASRTLRRVEVVACRRVQQARFLVVWILAQIVGVLEHARHRLGKQPRCVEQRRIALGTGCARRSDVGAANTQ